jgi:hypothetical protein
MVMLLTTHTKIVQAEPANINWIVVKYDFGVKCLPAAL